MLNDQFSKCWLRKSWKSRGDREIFSKILKVERRKRNGSKKEREIIFKSWKSRGERDMKISFSRAREKNLIHFSSRISRDRDSCQCLSLGKAKSIENQRKLCPEKVKSIESQVQRKSNPEKEMNQQTQQSESQNVIGATYRGLH